jgi:outer membrane lipoprotein LolB
MRATACAVATALLAGCASLSTPPIPTAPPESVSRFDVGGRLSAKRGAEGVAAHFSWTQVPGFDRIDVATPLGQTLARLVGDATGVRVERPGEAVESFAHWDALTRAVFGVAIPVEGLAAWVVGEPVADVPFGIERDDRARPSVLRQRGWEIVYAYAEGAPAQRPARLVMRYPDVEPVEVRIVIDRWTDGAAAGRP